MSSADSSERIARFSKTTRWFHWTFGLSFLLLAGTGGALGLRSALRIEASRAAQLRAVHEWAALFFLVVPWVVALSGDTRAWWNDLSVSSRFTRDDLRWLLRQARFWDRSGLPPQDKLNAGQKLNALAMAAISGAMIASGIVLWREPGAFGALLVHIAGFCAWIPAIAVHLFMAVVNPDTRPALVGMLRGDVSLAWARHHHAKWVDEQSGVASAPEAPRTAAPARAPDPSAAVSVVEAEAPEPGEGSEEPAT